MVDGHPFVARLEGDADEDAGVVVLVAHAEDDVHAAIADGSAGPVEQAHASMGGEQAVLDGHIAGADMLPAVEVLAVEDGGEMVGIGRAFIAGIAGEGE